MTFAVTTFKTKLATGGGGARPALYTVDINGPSGKSFSGNSNILVKAAAIPATNIAPLTVNYMGRAIKSHGFRTFDVWNVTVINDEDMAARESIMGWMRNIAGMLQGGRTNILGGDAEFLASTEGDATITQMGVDGTAKQTWKVHQMWPTELGEIALDWSSDAIEEYTVAFAYDYWSHGVKKSSKDKIKPDKNQSGQKSDYRLKDNITLLQEGTSSMPNIYLFRYKWDKENYFIGVMAQELLDTGYKNAVHKDSDGYYSVNYSRLGFPMAKISKSRI